MKLHHYLFVFLILFLPSQLGLHFWPRYAFISGIRIDYLSPTLYFTDIIFFLTMLVWLLSLSQKRFLNQKKLYIFGIVALLALINIFLSLSPFISAYRWIKVLEFALLMTYVASEFKGKVPLINKALQIGGVFSTFLAWAQFIKQSTLGGLFYYVGERTFSASTPGIALFNIGEREYLRPYASFAHPNVLAGYLVIVFLLTFRKSKFFSPFNLFILSGIAISYSQNAWLALGVSLLVFYSAKLKTLSMKTILPVSIVVSFIFSAASFDLLSKSGSLSFSSYERVSLAAAGATVMSSRPVFGVGLGTFITTLPDFYYDMVPRLANDHRWWLQPVHNMYLLLASEIGLVGLIFFFILLSTAIDRSRKNTQIFAVLVAVVLLGLNDHYLITLQQGQLLFGLILGLSFLHSSVE